MKYDPHIRVAADSYFLASDLEAFIFMPSRILLV